VAQAHNVNNLTWAELNVALMTADERTLTRWLRDTVAAGSLYRGLRVHGRLNALRKEREIAEIRAACVKIAHAEEAA
jgi:hypothetical protein